MKTLSLNPELTSQYLYLGSWDYTNILNRVQLNFNVKLGKYVSLFAGPAFSVYISDQKAGLADYRFPIPPSGYHIISFSNNVTGWFWMERHGSIFPKVLLLTGRGKIFLCC
jgi:hypothetical protein